MSTIIPRWEWRTFGTDFGAADATFAALEPEKIQESDEIYLLSPGTDANVKIRAGLMDIKTLEQIDEAGLEQWRPAMKETFPLPAARRDKVCAALGVRAARRDATPSRSTSSWRCSARRSAGCARWRSTSAALHYTINGCIVGGDRGGRRRHAGAHGGHRVGGRRPRGRGGAAMGLSGRPNTSYPRGLKAVVGMEG